MIRWSTGAPICSPTEAKEGPEEAKPPSRGQILNIIAKSDLTKFRNKSENEYSFFSNTAELVPKKFKDHVEKLIKDNNDLIVIIKRYENKKIDFIELGLKDIVKHKNQILSEFKKLTENSQKMISNIYEKYTFEQKNLEGLRFSLNGI